MIFAYVSRGAKLNQTPTGVDFLVTKKQNDENNAWKYILTRQKDKSNIFLIGSVKGRGKYGRYCIQIEDWLSRARSRLFISRNIIRSSLFELRRISGKIELFVSRIEYWNGKLNQIFSDQFHISLNWKPVPIEK